MGNPRPLNEGELLLAKQRGLDPKRIAIDDATGEVLESDDSAGGPATQDQRVSPTTAINAESSSKMGAAGRGFLSSVIPAIGGRLAGAGAGALALTPFGPPGEVIGGIGGAIAGGAAVGKAQDWALNKLGEHIPFIKDFQRQRQVDAEVHPYATQIGGLGSAAVGGGGGLIANSAKEAAKQAGIQGGVDVGLQAWENKGKVDPIQALLSAAGGAALSRPAPSVRRIERGLLSPVMGKSTAIDKAIEAVAPHVDYDTPPVVKPAIPDEGRYPHQRADWKPDALLSASNEQLASVGGPIEKALIILKEKGVNPTPEILMQLSMGGEGKIGQTVQTILRNKLPETVEQSQRLGNASAANQEQLAELQNRQATQAAVEGLVPKETPAKSAAESAAAIMARPGEVKSVNKDLADYKAKQVQLNKLKALHGKLSPEDQIALEPVIRQHEENLYKQADSLLNAADERLNYGDRSGETKLSTLSEETPPAETEVIPQSQPLQPSKPASVVEQAEIPLTTPKVSTPAPKPEVTVPEKPATVAAQTELMRQGNTPRKAVLITKGMKMPVLQPNETPTMTVKGTVVHDRSVSPIEVQRLAREDKLGSLLGYGVEGKPAGATEVVTVSKPDKTPVQEVLTNEETKPKVMEAAKATAQPGDKITIAKPEDTVFNRIGKGTTVEVDGKTHTVSQVGLSGNVGWKGNTLARMSKDEFLKKLTDGSLKVVAGAAKGIKEGEVASPKDLDKSNLDSLVNLANVKNVRNSLANKLKIIIQDEPEFLRYSGSEGKFLSEQSPEKQVEIYNKYLKALDETSSGGGMKLKGGLNKKNEGGFVDLGAIEALKKKVKDTWYRVRGPMNRMLESGDPIKYKFAKTVQEMNEQRDRRIGELSQPITENRLTVNEEKAVNDYLMERKYTGASNIKLNAAQTKLLDAVDAMYAATGNEKLSPDAPLIIEYDGNGKETHRPFKMTPGYVDENFSPAVRKTLASNDSAAKAEIRSSVRNWILKNNPEMTFDQADAYARNRVFGPVLGEEGINPEFKAARFAQGIGIPPELRGSAIEAALRHARKHATDMAWHQKIESNEVLNNALDLRVNGKGEKTPDVVYNENGKAIRQDLAGDTDVKDILADYVGTRKSGARTFENLNYVATSGKVQTWSQIRNLLTTPTSLMAHMNPSEYKYAIKGLMDAFSSKEQRASIMRGATRPDFNLGQTAALDAGEGASRLADMLGDVSGSLVKGAKAINKVTGVEYMEKVQRTFAESAGRSIARNRLSQGDVEFMNKWGPIEWRKWDPERLVDYIGVRISKASSGSYNAEELPSGLLQGANNIIKPFLSLSRQPIGQFNRYVDNVIKPARNGNLKPLIGSVLGGVLSTTGINYLTEQIMDRKPKELTAEEYLKLGGKDKAYTLFSKAMTANYAGILSSLLFSAEQLRTGEASFGFNNVLMSTAEDTAKRIGQYVRAVDDGTVEPVDGLATLAGSLLQDNIQLFKVLNPPEKSHKREERLARRTGYLPEKNIGAGNIRDPFSAAEAYRQDDPAMLRKHIINSAMKTGQLPSPTTALLDPRVYGFIKDSDSLEAARSAAKEDLTTTAKRQSTYYRALANRP